MKYPIWNDVNACIYKSSKSYGARDTSQAEVLVGSSQSNSHGLAKHITTRREHITYKGYLKVIVFKFSVNGIVLTEKIFKNVNGRAGELLKTNTVLNRMKGL